MDAENFGWVGGRKLAHVGEVALCRPRGRHAIVAEGASRILDSSEVKGRRPFDGTWLEHGLQQIPSNHLILRVGDPTPIDQLADDVPHLPKRLRQSLCTSFQPSQDREYREAGLVMVCAGELVWLVPAERAVVAPLVDNGVEERQREVA